MKQEKKKLEPWNCSLIRQNTKDKKSVLSRILFSKACAYNILQTEQKQRDCPHTNRSAGRTFTIMHHDESKGSRRLSPTRGNYRECATQVQTRRGPSTTYKYTSLKCYEPKRKDEGKDQYDLSIRQHPWNSLSFSIVLQQHWKANFNDLRNDALTAVMKQNALFQKGSFKIQNGVNWSHKSQKIKWN